MSFSSDNPCGLLSVWQIIDGVAIGITILGVHVESVNDAQFNASNENEIDVVHFEGYLLEAGENLDIYFDMFSIP